MADNKDNSIKEKVIRYLAGKAGAEEERAVMDYILAGADNERQFREWEAEWERNPEEAPETEEAWRKVEARMADTGSEAEEKHTVRWAVAARWARMAAASVALLVVGALAARYYHLSVEPEQYCVSSAPAGSKSCVSLPDSTKVWLNAGSSLKYSTRFGETGRSVELHGEAYFEVAESGGKTFTVRTDGYDVVVRGTKFNVRAYSDEPAVSTTLFEGRVDISQEDEPKLTLEPGETAVYDKASKSLSKCVGCTGGNGWMNGDIEFDNITFNELAAILNRTFNVNIHADSPAIGNMRLSVSLHNHETVDDVVEAIRLLGKVKITRHGKDILVH